MQRITSWAMATITVVVLLFSYRTSLHSDLAVASGNKTVQTGSTSAGAASRVSTAGSQGTGSTGSTGSRSTRAAKTFTGNSVDTRWGPVQVQITVSGGKITAAQAVVYPNGNQNDMEINNAALPILADEAVKAQSSQIDAVSGATFTSDGYISSLQSAIDQANL